MAHGAGVLSNAGSLFGMLCEGPRRDRTLIGMTGPQSGAWECRKAIRLLFCTNNQLFSVLGLGRDKES